LVKKMIYITWRRIIYILSMLAKFKLKIDGKIYLDLTNSLSTKMCISPVKYLPTVRVLFRTGVNFTFLRHSLYYFMEETIIIIFLLHNCIVH